MSNTWRKGVPAGAYRSPEKERVREAHESVSDHGS